MKQRFILTSICLLLILSPVFSSLAADTTPREFTPVQKGFVASGEKVLPYAPDRIIVKFKRSSIDKSNLSIGLQATRPLPDATTGLMSIDVIGKDAGVKKISRAYILMKDRAQAERLGSDQWFRIDLEKGTDIPALVERYAADPNVEYAKPDWRAFPAAVPSDPLYADSWGHNNTAQLPDLDWGGTYSHTLSNTVGTAGFDANAQAAWNSGYGDASVIIAILDSGVDIDHPDLNLVSGYDFGDSDSNPDDNSSSAGHGTCCAGVAAAIANNGLGSCGAAPGCSIMPCKVANSAGSMYFSYIENAIYWAADNGADIISMSLGAVGVSSDPSTDAAITYAYNAGCVILAATGNENDDAISYPAINSYVIGVGAASPCGDRKRSSSSSSECNSGVSTDPNGYTCDGERWWGSSYGVNTKDASGAVDILGPTILPTTDIGGSGGYESGDYSPFFNGTSCATPYVAGVAALVKSANPSWTPAQIRDQICDTAIDVVNVESGSGWDRYSGYGMVDAEAAVGGGGPVAPVAEFVGSPTSGTEPLTVSFTDQSTGSPTNWSWNFGDGGNSTQQNPGHTYNSSGNYTVALTVTNSADNDTETKTSYITVNACVLPVAEFTASTTSGNVPLTVNFTDQSTGAASWSWTFGDGGTSTSQNPSHTYTAEGTYTVTLTATNSCGNDVETKTNYITVNPCVNPVAGFTASTTSGEAPLSVSFTDQSTGAASWSWTFGDGGTSTAQNPSHNYTAEGTYTVALTATNSCGNDVETKTDYITVNPCVNPVAGFTASTTSGEAPLSVSFTDQSTGAASWSWTFGDGGTSTAQNPSHTYTAEGTYTVALTATNSCGSDIETETDYITVTAGTGGFCDDFSDGDASDWVATGGTWSVIDGQLDGSDAGYVINIAPAGDIGAGTITVDWTSLTGGSWTNGMVVFGYIDAQNYRVVDCRDGANDWYIRQFVNGTQTNLAQLAETINTNQLYQLVVDIDESGLVTLTADGVEKVSYAFGNVVTGKIGVAVQNAHSQFDNFCIDSGVAPPDPPVAAFSGTPTSGTLPLDVQFTDATTGDPASWSWTFGDGGTSTAQNPSYTYTAAGTYTVTLMATNAGGSDGETKTDYITVTDPGGGSWVTITYDEFESGWGSYSDGGRDCSRYTSGTRAHQGSAALDIQDNSGTSSSFYHTAGYDVSGYTTLEVEFWFYAYSMDRSGEDFWVQFYDGSTWQTVGSFNVTVDFVNETFYNEVVTISSASYNFPTGAKLRFMCDASGNADDVYIDEIEWRGITGTPTIASSSRGLAFEKPVLPETPGQTALSQNYPNPFNPSTTIKFDLAGPTNVQLSIYDAAGRLVRTLVNETRPAGFHEAVWNGRTNAGMNAASGIYFYRIIAGDFVETKKMILLR